jgi:tRNA threonylcarbamoyladenosine biosynthesis protein TsaE
VNRVQCDPLVFHAQSLADTDRLGAALARALLDRGVVALDGPLGAGKTALVQAIAAADGVPRRIVTSPTFVVVQSYEGRRPIVHVDAYRLAGAEEFAELGGEELFERPGLTLVEWGARIADALPDDRLDIAIEQTGETSRRFTICTGPIHAAALARLAANLHPS